MANLSWKHSYERHNTKEKVLWCLSNWHDKLMTVCLTHGKCSNFYFMKTNYNCHGDTCIVAITETYEHYNKSHMEKNKTCKQRKRTNTITQWRTCGHPCPTSVTAETALVASLQQTWTWKTAIKSTNLPSTRITWPAAAAEEPATLLFHLRGPSAERLQRAAAAELGEVGQPPRHPNEATVRLHDNRPVAVDDVHGVALGLQVDQLAAVHAHPPS